MNNFLTIGYHTTISTGYFVHNFCEIKINERVFIKERQFMSNFIDIKMLGSKGQFKEKNTLLTQHHIKQLV